MEVTVQVRTVVPEVFVIPAVGNAFTTIDFVAAALEQPPVPLSVYEIVAEPGLTPTTVPTEFTVAIEAEEEVHVPPEVPFVEKVAIPFTQIPSVPLSVPGVGGADTMTAPETAE
jgi:hypothetical protein